MTKKINGYSKNLNVQMIIAFMQSHGVRRVIVSPGTTHFELVAGLQYNGNFELYSCLDERGAAYMACGMAAESGEPVAITCTESVASRNYFSAMTEAHYRQLPILAITAVHSYSKIGHLHSQTVDRSISPKDTFHFKAQLPILKDSVDVWESNVLLNKAFLELRDCRGPVHIDLPKSEIIEFSAKELYKTRIIQRYEKGQPFPTISQKKIAVYIGTHVPFDNQQTKSIDAFCATYNAVVFCGHTSGYKGKYRVLSNLVALQKGIYEIFKDIDLLIHVGGPAADEATMAKLKSVNEVWRVNPDGEVRDTFRKLSNIFKMNEKEFFEYYNNQNCQPQDSFLKECYSLTAAIEVSTPKLPFSNVYVASVLSKKLPSNSLIHIGLSNSIRAWSMFDFPETVSSDSNTGVRGIDGVLSAFLGASFVDRNKLCFCVLGDLTFFYDMNALGNRSIGNNVRILLINNGGGGLFKTSTNEPYKYLGEDVNQYIAAMGHFGHESPVLVKSYTESLGFEYMTASNKEEFNTVYKRFVTSEMTDKPMMLEIFTKDYEERAAFDMMANIDITAHGVAKQMAKQVLGKKGINTLKKVIRPNG